LTPGPDFEYKNKRTKMQLVCPNGCFYHTLMSAIVKGCSCNCDNCSGLKRERRCREWFENRFKKPFPKARPRWLKNHTGRCLELDGYCEELSIAFEHNGEQHYKPCRFSVNQTEEEIMKNFEDQQQKDILKAKLCAEQGIELVIIPYNKNVDKFLEDYFTRSCEVILATVIHFLSDGGNDEIYNIKRHISR
jgi:hypothetical protein